MITLLGSSRRLCDGLTRRETLKAGALSLLGGFFNLPSLLQAEENRPGIDPSDRCYNPTRVRGFRRREREDPSMSQAPANLDPWRLVWGQPYIDSRTLAAAIEQDLLREPDPDFRTRLLVRDASVALRSYWRARRFLQWLEGSPVGPRIRQILDEDLGETGFPAIRRRLVDSIDSTRISRIFELLGLTVGAHHEAPLVPDVPNAVEATRKKSKAAARALGAR